MPKGSGGGGNGGRSGGGGGGSSGPSLQDAINSGEVSAQNLPGGATQLTHAKATVRYDAKGAEVWSSKYGGKAFRPSGKVESYADRVEAVKEFARRTGIKL
jgi:hypothetical protein